MLSVLKVRLLSQTQSLKQFCLVYSKPRYIQVEQRVLLLVPGGFMESWGEEPVFILLDQIFFSPGPFLSVRRKANHSLDLPKAIKVSPSSPYSHILENWAGRQNHLIQHERMVTKTQAEPASALAFTSGKELLSEGFLQAVISEQHALRGVPYSVPVYESRANHL